MEKIALIIPYYGKFNNYFKLWLQSAGQNSIIQFILITDIDMNMEQATNITIVNKSFEKLKQDIQALFDFRIQLETPYKLCEYRPVYGKLCEELLKEYEFWGYGDIDLIYGNIGEFITEEILKKYDVILSHGHFMLYRNRPDLNQLYLEKDAGVFYKQAFTSNDSFHFDEWGGISRKICEKNIPMYDEVVFADIRYQFFDFRLAQGRHDHQKRIYVWDRGELYEYALGNGKIEKKKRMYIHLQKRDMEWDGVISDRYIIFPNTIIGSWEEIGEEFIQKHVKKKNIYWHYAKFRIRYCIKKLLYKTEDFLKR